MTFLLFLLVPAAGAAGLEKVRLPTGRVIDALPGQVIVRYRDAAQAQGRAKLSALGARTRNSIPALRIDLVSVPAGRSIESFLAQLNGDPNVEFAEPNGIMRASAFPQDPPDDPIFSSQFPLAYNADGSNLSNATINIRPAWSISLGTPSVVVAVVDTGADLNNPELAGKFVQGRRFRIDWLSDGNCDDTVGTQPELGVCNGCAGVGPDQCEDPDAEDDNNIDENLGNVSPNPTYHGTRVSGIIAATTNNGFGMAGIAPNCRIMPLKVLNSWGFGTFFSIAEGITFAAQNGASVINLSLGGTSADPTGAVQAAISLALDRDCVLVAASGNSGRLTAVNFPASFPGVIAVGSIDNVNGLSEFSATGKSLDLVAPGEGVHNDSSDGIFGVVPTTVTVAGANKARGTSFAAPMVAGVAALIRSVNPSLSWQKVTQYIDFTATDLGAPGFDNNVGFGRLNAGAAVQAASANVIFASNPAEPGETFPYPNPFRPGPGRDVVIALPASLGSEGIEITIMNLAGEKVKTLTGVNLWDGRNDDGDIVAAGLYFYFAKTSRGDAKGKLTLIK